MNLCYSMFCERLNAPKAKHPTKNNQPCPFCSMCLSTTYLFLPRWSAVPVSCVCSRSRLQASSSNLSRCSASSPSCEIIALIYHFHHSAHPTRRSFISCSRKSFIPELFHCSSHLSYHHITSSL
uniref:(northern house mosquito) hypothetical protein n=1 Tax=Culex pipiens TaxID=7175 RepID=A0A8D7ZTN3_CULPI